jgi:hypothetical protein
MTSEVDILAQKVWDYHHLNHPVEKSGAILVMGSHDLRVAERGAQLFLEHWTPLLIFSGGLGNLTRGVWEHAEADLQRIRLYPAKGFQIPQEIPPDVWAAGQELIHLGHSQNLIRG